MQQVLLTLHFYATASFHQVIGDLFGMSYYAVYKVKHRVSRAISKHKRKFTSFPVDFHETKRSFYDIAGFPCVLWTHVRIVCPDRKNVAAFIDRKKLYSVNVQAVCDSKALITSVVELIFQWIHWRWNIKRQQPAYSQHLVKQGFYHHLSTCFPLLLIKFLFRLQFHTLPTSLNCFYIALVSVGISGVEPLHNFFPQWLFPFLSWHCHILSLSIVGYCFPNPVSRSVSPCLLG